MGHMCGHFPNRRQALRLQQLLVHQRNSTDHGFERTRKIANLIQRVVWLLWRKITLGYDLGALGYLLKGRSSRRAYNATPTPRTTVKTNQPNSKRSGARALTHCRSSYPPAR